MNKRLYRSGHDKKISGLCGGIGQFLHIDSTLVRVGVVLLTFFTGVPILLYILLALLVPKEPLWMEQSEAYGNSFFAYEPYTHLDSQIERLEKRALQQEVTRLRAELAKYK